MEEAEATDNYLLKSAAHPAALYVQVSDPNMDHKCSERPANMDRPLNVYKIDVVHTGSDVAAEIATASMVFNTMDATYSELLEFADKYIGAYSDSLRKFFHFTTHTQDIMMNYYGEQGRGFLGERNYVN